MNKIKMGKFLKELRKSNCLTMNGLLARLDYENLTVTTKAIIDWEKGETIPELEKLVFLAKLYGVSVDEILDGERFLTKEKLLEKYPLFSYKLNDIDKIENFHDKRDECIKEMNKRFIYLVKKVYTGELSRNEKIELDFIFKHKCKLSEFCPDISHDEFVSFYRELKELKLNPTITNLDEFWWEAQKLFDNSGEYITSISFGTIADEGLFNGYPFVDYLISQAEPWEMDMLVAGFQNFDPIFIESDSHSNALRRYKDKHGIEFDRERIYKSTLKYLLTHGGMLNPYFYSFYEKKTKKIKVIDRLEELYKLCLRPIEIYVIDDERQEFQKRLFIENNRFNRFLDKYHRLRFIITNEKDADELNPKALYDVVYNDDKEEKIVQLLSKYKGIDTNRDRNYVLADLSIDLKIWRDAKNELLNREVEIANGLTEIKHLEELLEKKEMAFDESYIEEIGPKKPSELSKYIKLWKRPISLSEFNSERNKELTEQLLNEIDELTIQEIRNKYFFKETHEGGADND